MDRHYGMDWLRIGAFAVLILYHVGMVFGPWGYHAKATQTLDWVAIPMLAASPWRLTLLLLVSGYASRALLARAPDLGGFARTRTLRLLVPLAFGVVVIVPPQSWVELVTQHGYRRDFMTFVADDYYRFGSVDGVILPTWNHLWFVGYLWLYSMALALLLTVPRPARLQRWFDRAFGGYRALALPIAWLLVTQVIVFERWTDTHDVIGDGVAHLAFFPAFLFGFALAGSIPVMAALKRGWPAAAVIAVAAYAAVAVVTHLYPYPRRVPDLVSAMLLWARQIQCWAAIAALIGAAEAHLNRDHPWRRTLAEAVFPIYIVHQTIIVVAAWWLRPLALPLATQAAVLVAATAAGGWAFYLAGRRIRWLRPLIGLRPLVSPPPSATVRAPA